MHIMTFFKPTFHYISEIESFPHVSLTFSRAEVNLAMSPMPSYFTILSDMEI